MRAILAFPSSRHGWSPNARIERHLADVATTVRDWDGDAFPRLDGIARLRVCAARLPASFARSPVALTVRRRACVKGFHDDAKGAETRRRRLDATRDLARSCSASAVRVDARRAARWRSRFARASVAARPRGRAHAGCFIRVFAYRRDAFHVFWSRDTDPCPPSSPLFQASRVIIEKYYSRLTLDFATNKRIAEDVAIIPSKRLRNKIAGFTTHLMKRIQRGPVRGISLKLQEEERERRMDFVPDESALSVESIEVDRDTMDMLKSLNMANLPAVTLQQRSGNRFQGNRKEGGGGNRN